MSTFRKWYEEADMPTRDEDGVWVDMETGIGFESSHEYEEKKKPVYSKMSQKALNNREVARLFGGYALTGTKKQKEWAEQIRADILKQISDLRVAEMLCGKDWKSLAPFTQSSKFWIENRDKKASEFTLFVDKIIELTKKINSAHREIVYETRLVNKKRYNSKREDEFYQVEEEFIKDSSKFDSAVAEEQAFLKNWRY